MTLTRITARLKLAAAALLCSLGAPRVLRWLSARSFPGAVRILYCHDIAAAADDEGGRRTDRAPGTLDAAEFERRLDHLRRHYSIIGLDDALSRLQRAPRAGRVPVLLTFDDGYRSFLDTVYPALRRHRAPVVLSVATGRVGADGLWTDAVRSALPSAEPLIAELKRMPDDERRRAVRDLCEASPSAKATERKMLTWNELKTLAVDQLVTIGAHSVSHPILSTLPDSRAEAEIAQSGRDLERELGARPSVFAYPNGSREDFTDEHERMVRAAGYRVAFSTVPGLALAGSNLHCLPRTCLGWEPWPRFVLRMAGWDDLLDRARSLFRRGAVTHPRSDSQRLTRSPSARDARRV